MASEQKKKRTTATTSKKSSAKKGQTRSVTVASTKGKGGKKPAGKAKKPTKTPVDAERRRNFSEQYMPYILGAVGFLTLVFFLVSVICAVAGVDHWMGPVGYGISYFFFGMFGWPAFSIPVLLLYLAVFWRRNCRENTVVLRQIPMDLDPAHAAEAIEEMAADLLNGRREKATSVRDEILHTVACKAAIKAGWKNDEAELLAVAKEVMSRDDLKHCPHGRPICITLSKKQLEKQFKRS